MTVYLLWNRARVAFEGRRPTDNYIELSTSSKTRGYILMLRAVILTLKAMFPTASISIP